jgi:toxin ParE1/3/4
MTGRYRILPAADRDLDDQAAYLAEQASLETALRFYDATRSAFSNIARMPGRVEQQRRAVIIGRSTFGRPTRLADRRLRETPDLLPAAASGIEVIRILQGHETSTACWNEDMETDRQAL